MGRICDYLAAQGIVLAQQPRQKMLAFDRELEELEAKVKALDAECLHLRAKVRPLENEVQRVKDQVQKSSSGIQSDNPLGYRCDACGSNQLIRIGSRPDPTFGVLGTKQAVFRCAKCRAESAFTP